jgi:hypothetical protein
MRLKRIVEVGQRRRDHHVDAAKQVVPRDEVVEAELVE